MPTMSDPATVNKPELPALQPTAGQMPDRVHLTAEEIELIARKVFELLRHELRVERERIP